MELQAPEQGEGVGEVGEEVRCQGREGGGVDVGLWEGVGHGGGGGVTFFFWNEDQLMQSSR